MSDMDDYIKEEIRELIDKGYIPDAFMEIDGHRMIFDFKTANPNPNVNQVKLYEKIFGISETIPMIKVIEENGEWAVVTVQVPSIFYEIHMRMLYGPGWACEGMGV